MNAGIDLGTTYIKTHNGLVFPSGISRNICMSKNVMTYEGQQYAVELFNSNADYSVNINKGLNDNIKLNYIYALFKIAKQEETIFEKTVVGLPCSQWINESTVEQFKKLLDLSSSIYVDVNGQTKILQVDDCKIVPEGATAYYCLDNKKYNGRKTLLLDWGSRTLNQILFENDEPIAMHTDNDGVLKIYKEMAERVTSVTGHDVKYEEMYDILSYGLTDKGKIIDVSDIVSPIAIENCKRIYRNLNVQWSVDTIPYIPMVGGGAIMMSKYISKFIPHVELQNEAQSLAAMGMGRLVGAVA
jgi:hypothetical protein